MQMLRNQVDALQELADSKSTNCMHPLAKDMESQFAMSKEVIRQELQVELRITIKEEIKETIIDELRLEDLVQMIDQKNRWSDPLHSPLRRRYNLTGQLIRSERQMSKRL